VSALRVDENDDDDIVVRFVSLCDLQNVLHVLARIRLGFGSGVWFWFGLWLQLWSSEGQKFAI